MDLDLAQDAAALTACLVDVASVSGDEELLADAIAGAVQALPHLAVHRDGNAVIARTSLGRPERVVLAGHIDTVPVAGNLPSYIQRNTLYGCGSCDMKSGVAVQLRLAALMSEPNRDVTYVFYDCEEVEEDRNGLLRLSQNCPELLTGDFAVLLEPTGAVIEGGCQGGYVARQPEVDGLTYHEGLNAVYISGGVAGNVIPDECVVTVNFRFAPDRSIEQAQDHVRAMFEGWDVAFTDGAAGARPGLADPAAASLLSVVGGVPRAKLGWTDVARFAALGMPAVNYGPGDPEIAHTRNEHVSIPEIAECEARLLAWLA